MSTDKTTAGDFKILLAIIACAGLIWGFFRYKSSIRAAVDSSPASQNSK